MTLSANHRPVLVNHVFVTSHPEAIGKWSWMSIPRGLDWGRVRDEYIKTFGFAVLTPEVVEVLVKLCPLIEVGSGAGYWAFELKRIGCDIVATDPVPLDQNQFKFSHEWTEVERLTAMEAVDKYPGRNLLIVWPSYDEPWTDRFLPFFQGEYIAYVGEGHGGCTATDDFHDYLQEHFEEVETVQQPQFFGLRDSLFIYRRKPAMEVQDKLSHFVSRTPHARKFRLE